MATATQHVKEHGETEAAYSCTFCDLLFMSSEKLDEHIGDEHLDDMEAYNAADDKEAADNAIQEAMECDNNDLQQTLEEFFVDEKKATTTTTTTTDDVIIKKEKDGE